jgi:hypothetical protein
LVKNRKLTQKTKMMLGPDKHDNFYNWTSCILLQLLVRTPQQQVENFSLNASGIFSAVTARACFCLHGAQTSDPE